MSVFAPQNGKCSFCHRLPHLHRQQKSTRSGNRKLELGLASVNVRSSKGGDPGSFLHRRDLFDPQRFELASRAGSSDIRGRAWLNSHMLLAQTRFARWSRARAAGQRTLTRNKVR
jgi:hypothetical protein